LGFGSTVAPLALSNWKGAAPESQDELRPSLKMKGLHSPDMARAGITAIMSRFAPLGAELRPSHADHLIAPKVREGGHSPHASSYSSVMVWHVACHDEFSRQDSSAEESFMGVTRRQRGTP